MGLFTRMRRIHLPFRDLMPVMIGLLLVVQTMQARAERSVSDRERPNVVFFLVDDLGWRDLGCQGSRSYETPRIDAFARDAVRFTDAYAACHVCSPTRASILTGKYPARLGLTDWIPGRRDFSFQQFLNVRTRQHLPYEEISLAETLREAGYRTAAIGKWHLGSEPSGPAAHGFDEHLPRNWPRGAPNGTYFAPYRLEGLSGPTGEYLTDRLTDEAEKFIETNRGRPFFLYLAHYAVHDPIEGRRDLVTRYAGKLNAPATGNAPPFILEGNPDDKHPLTTHQRRVRLHHPEWARHRVHPDRTVRIKQYQDNVEFAGMVTAVDESLGRILDQLAELKLEQNTIVVLFSDNGGMSAANFWDPERVVSANRLDRAYSTSNLPLRGGKGWLYEGGIRVPLIIKWPGRGLRGHLVDTPVISTDFYPTILEMLGLPAQPDQHCDGVSLAPLLTGGDLPGRDAIFWHFPHYSNHGRQSPGGAVRAGNYKLLEYFENGSVQLFDLHADIGEQHDLSEERPEKVAELKKLLKEWRSQVGAKMMAPNPDFQPAAPIR